MSVDELLGRLAEKGVDLWVEQDNLRFRAPKGALGDELRAEIAAVKPELLARLRASAGSDARAAASSPAQATEAGSPQSVQALLERLRSLDIRLALDGERLTVSAPKGAMTDALRAELGARKDEIKQHLQRAPGGMPKTDAAIPRVDKTGELPVSHNQQRLWFMKQMNPGSSAYNIPGAFRMKGALDVAALERALALLVDRHEALRTHFVAMDGMPRCVVSPTGHLPLQRVDLSQLDAQASQEEAMRRLAELADRPLDLARSPMMSVTLIRLPADEHMFVFVLDHIIADGISMGIMVSELEALYTQEVSGAQAALRPLPVQYVDYAEWQRRWLASGALAEQLSYWKAKLAGAPEMLSLPTDRPRPPVQTYLGSRRIVRYPAPLSDALKAMCRGEGVTLYMAMMAGFQVLLHRYSGETDIVVGSATASRPRPEIEGLMGFFANNIVLRSDLSGDPTVRALLKQVRGSALKAYEHQEVPFDMLVDAIAPQRALGHSPIFQSMLVLHGRLPTTIHLPGLECEPLQIPIGTARFDLCVDLFDMPEGLVVFFEYSTALFDASTVERMLDHYRTLLEGMAAQPDSPVGALPMMSHAEQQSLLDAWRCPALPTPEAETIHGLFEAQAARSPDAPALRFADQTLSYGELNRRANRLARHLLGIGTCTGSLVGIWMERSTDMVVAMLAVLKAGAAYVPLDPSFPRERIDFMVADAGLAAIVSHGSLAGAFSGHGIPCVAVDAELQRIDALDDGNLAPTSGPGDVAYVIYTSGSTGKPKGVQIEHHSVVNFLRSMQREPGIGPDDRLVAVTTLSFDIAGLEIHGPLTCGGTVVLASRATAVDGLALAELLETSRATILQATPATWRLLLESGWQGRAGLKMLCGGEALPRELAQRLLALDGELWNMYGPTETTIWSTVFRVTDAGASIPIGRPIADTSLFVLEPCGQPAPIGVAGELCIGGAGVARGYLNRPELTAEKFIPLSVAGRPAERVYRTGDLARIRSDGQLEFIGRRDHQVKLRGFRIELGEIETVLAGHPGVQHCVVQVREDKPGDQRLVAYVVPAGGVTFDADRARATLRTALPEYMIPNLFATLDALPLTPNGKVDRKALPAPTADAPRGDVAAAADALMNPQQQRVATAWRELLGIDRVGLRDNFFDLGGHSLLLVKLQVALRREFGAELPLVDLFQHTTVESQSERLASRSTDNGALERARARAARQLNA
jgi:amino acid adenylation domain-containing protein